MLSLIFDLRFKSFHLVSSYYVGNKQGVFIGEQHEFKFHVVGFFAKQLLRIASSQIEIEHIFSLVGILKCLKKYRLQSEILNK
jgi:hypothetical protein